MNISDLNHFEVVNPETGVVGGDGGYYGAGVELYVDLYKDVDVYVDVYVDEYKKFDVYSDVDGVSAFAEAEALAYGKDAHAESLTFSYTENGFASASAQSTSLTGSGY